METKNEDWILKSGVNWLAGILIVIILSILLWVIIWYFGR